MKPENRPKITFEGREYDDYQATQKQRQIERTIRKQKRLKAAFEAAGLSAEADAAGAKLRTLNQKYWEFSKAVGLPEQRERLRVLDTSKAASHGQSAGGVGPGLPGKLIQIGSVDFSNRNAVLAQIAAAQAETAKLDYEVNHTVTADGKVWRVVGDAEEVHPESIPGSLAGSYSYHNHPAAQTWFSFSAEDVRFFFESGAAYAKASDHLYEYIMERTPETLAVSPDKVYHRFKEIYDKDILRLSFDGKLNIDMDGFHETMRRMSQEYHFHYERMSLSGD